jgi:uncharacterized membrane protein YidH (DUF202 family)
MKSHQALLVAGLAMPLLSLFLDELFTTRGYMTPIEFDPWNQILLVFLILSISFTPVTIYNNFAKYAMKARRHRTELAGLAVVFYVGYFAFDTAAEFGGLLPLPLALSIFAFLLPPSLTFLSGWGLAHQERSIQNNSHSQANYRITRYRSRIEC